MTAVCLYDVLHIAGHRIAEDIYRISVRRDNVDRECIVCPTRPRHPYPSGTVNPQNVVLQVDESSVDEFASANTADTGGESLADEFAQYHAPEKVRAVVQHRDKMLAVLADEFAQYHADGDKIQPGDVLVEAEEKSTPSITEDAPVACQRGPDFSCDPMGRRSENDGGKRRPPVLVICSDRDREVPMRCLAETIKRVQEVGTMFSCPVLSIFGIVGFRNRRRNGSQLRILVALAHSAAGVQLEEKMIRVPYF